MNRCYSCGEYELETVNTWLPHSDEEGEWLYARVCRNCDYGCGYVDGLEIAAAVLTTYGIAVQGRSREDGYLDCIEFDFCLEPDSVQVIYWQGAYPFANDTVMGNFDTIEEAARYVKWLYAREALYAERDDRMIEEAYQALKGMQS